MGRAVMPTDSPPPAQAVVHAEAFDVPQRLMHTLSLYTVTVGLPHALLNAPHEQTQFKPP